MCFHGAAILRSMVHHRKTHTVCVYVCHYCIQRSFIHIHLLAWRVECRICKWKLLFVDRTFVAAFAKLTSFRDVGSSFSYIAPTD